MSAPVERTCRVAIVGSGPAGLTAAAALAPVLDGPVLVVEREPEPGGIPRHSDHLGYGLRDLRRFLSGPSYARELTARANAAGAEITCSATVTHWDGPRRLVVTSPQGRSVIAADAVVLATGARERPRAARRIPGSRPAGVYTTGQLQNLVHLHHRPVGSRAVVVGAELVSWSAVMTLRHAGTQVALMTSRFARSESYAAFRLPGRLVYRVPVATRTAVAAIHGARRVEAVELEDLDTGERRRVACDTVVFTGDWIPDHELVRAAGIDLDPATLGPVVDTALSTTTPGVFAIGNLAHPVDTADVAALDGSHVVDHVLAWLKDRSALEAGLPLTASAPFTWIAPQIVRPRGPRPARDRLLLWTDEYRNAPVVIARQSGRVIGRRRLPWPAAPGRAFRVPYAVVEQADPHGGPVTLSLD